MRGNHAANLFWCWVVAVSLNGGLHLQSERELDLTAGELLRSCTRLNYYYIWSPHLRTMLQLSP